MNYRKLYEDLKEKYDELFNTLPQNQGADVIKIGNATFNGKNRRIFFNGVEIKLIKKEYSILATFFVYPDRIFNRKELINITWGKEVFISERGVDTVVCGINKKFGVKIIGSVSGIGYELLKNNL